MKVSKAEEYFVYFPLLKPHSWGKRSAVQPKAICSEFPLLTEVLLMYKMEEKERRV